VSGGRLPCGCIWDVVGEGFVFQPCSLDCANWAAVRDAISGSGKPMRVLMDPGLRGTVPPVHQCPGCGKVQDAHTDISGGGGAVPDEGDVGVCGDCGAVFEFMVGGPVLLDEKHLHWAFESHPALADAVAQIKQRRAR
jgi:hypothetical protein